LLSEPLEQLKRTVHKIKDKVIGIRISIFYLNDFLKEPGLILLFTTKFLAKPLILYG
jgi:hypothetical protein